MATSKRNFKVIVGVEESKVEVIKVEALRQLRTKNSLAHRVHFCTCKDCTLEKVDENHVNRAITSGMQ